MDKHETRQELVVHLVFTVLFFASAYFGEGLSRELPGWREPRVGVFTVVIGLVWLLWFGTRRIGELQDRQRVLEDRIDRAQRRIDALEDEEERLG